MENTNRDTNTKESNNSKDNINNSNQEQKNISRRKSFISTNYYTDIESLIKTEYFQANNQE